MKTIHFFFYFAFLCETVNAQTTTVTVTTGPDWSDVLLLKSLKPSEAYLATTNYNTYPRLASTAWTHSGYQISYGSLLKFDLTTIPVGTVVVSATLQFYSDGGNTSGELSNQSLSGANTFYLQKVTQAWNAATVTWNTQPTTSTTNRVWVGPSASSTENLSVNLATLVQDMINNPSTNHGLMMMLENEVYYRSRSYASTDHASSNLHPKLVIVLSTPPRISTAWSDAMESVFQNVNRSYVTTGFLADYGIYLTNLEKFNGTPSDTNYIEYHEWKALYATLFTCRFNTNSVMDEMQTVNAQVETQTVLNPSIHLLLGLHYRYDRFKANALESNLVYIINEKIYDTPNRPVSPYEVRDAFAIVPKQSVLQGGNHQFLFKPQLFYTNTGKTINAILFDAGDGLGYQPISFDVPRSVTYTTEGEKIFSFKITYTDNTFLESRTKLLVANIVQANAAARLSSQIESFLFTATKTFQAPGESQPKAGRATITITISYANTDKVLRKPFIVLEGFDPSGITGENHFGFNEFMGGTNFGGHSNPRMNLVINYTFNGKFYNTLKDAIEGEDFDIVFVDYENGTDWIERNAYMVENLITWVNARKQPYNGVAQKNVVMGTSMGGMIGRYALRDMELSICQETNCALLGIIV